ncbi:MAG: hypothetical protein ACYCWW_19120, partial [Deltaproteobacteria bacterium]
DCAVAIGGPSLEAPLAAALARAPRPERFTLLDPEVAREAAPPAAFSPLPPKPAERAGGGPSASRTRALPAAAAVLAVAALGAALAIHDAPPSKAEILAAIEAGAQRAPRLTPPGMTDREAMLARYALSQNGPAPAQPNATGAPPDFLPLALRATIPKGYGGFQLAIANPVREVAVTHYGGDVVWSLTAPKLGSVHKIALVPGDYLVEFRPALRGAFRQVYSLTIGEPGEIERWKTPKYVLRAPPKEVVFDPTDPFEPYGPLTPEELQRFAG